MTCSFFWQQRFDNNGWSGASMCVTTSCSSSLSSCHLSCFRRTAHRSPPTSSNQHATCHLLIPHTKHETRFREFRTPVSPDERIASFDTRFSSVVPTRRGTAVGPTLPLINRSHALLFNIHTNHISTAPPHLQEKHSYSIRRDTQISTNFQKIHPTTDD